MLSIASTLSSLRDLARITERAEALIHLAALLGYDEADDPTTGQLEARLHSLIALRDAVLDGEVPDALLALAQDCGEPDWDDGDTPIALTDCARECAELRRTLAQVQTDIASPPVGWHRRLLVEAGQRLVVRWERDRDEADVEWYLSELGPEMDTLEASVGVTVAELGQILIHESRRAGGES